MKTTAEIKKMSLIELMNFVKSFDPIKYQTMNWFKGQTTAGLRIQVINIYNKHNSK